MKDTMVQAGDQIPEWVMPEVSAQRMQTMAAILRDPNPVHWDRQSVAALGLGERTINQGPLGLGYMVNMLHACFGENCVRHLHINFPNPLILDGDQITAKGMVTAIREVEGEQLADCEIWLERDGQRGLIEGTAEVALPD